MNTGEIKEVRAGAAGCDSRLQAAARRGALQGPRHEIDCNSHEYPDALRELHSPPQKLYVVGNPSCLRMGLSIVGARKATPYGKGCARRFAALAAQAGVPVVSGGALGCDSAAHQGALEAHGLTVAVLGGGCDHVYPAQNRQLFQRIVDEGGAVISENEWDFKPLPYAFRMRNRIIAALSRATLIVEAGLPSGTFSTADEALSLGKEVLVVPGAITAPTSKGANRLLFQGATPIIDDEVFQTVLLSLYPPGELNMALGRGDDSLTGNSALSGLFDDPLIGALVAEPLDAEEIHTLAQRYCGRENPAAWAALRIEEAQDAGIICRYPDGSYGPLL